MHVLHNDYSIDPEKLAIPYDMLSDYCKKNCRRIWNKSWGCHEINFKLVDKTNYVLHYKNLRLYFFLGMKLTKLHRVLKFKQSVWLKKYINFNIGKRINAANRLKDILKLMINSVFGKTI